MFFRINNFLGKLGNGNIKEIKYFRTDGKNTAPSGYCVYNGGVYSQIRKNKKSFKYTPTYRKYMCKTITKDQYGLLNYRGGVIVFSTSVNTVVDKEEKSKIKAYIKKAYLSTINLILKNKKLNKFVKKWNEDFGSLEDKQIGAFSVGNLFDGKYISENGETYNDKSLSIDFDGVPSEILLLFAIRICKEYNQESVLVKDYNTNKIYLVENIKFSKSDTIEKIFNINDELKNLKMLMLMRKYK